jgi:hypothetical protein
MKFLRSSVLVSIAIVTAACCSIKQGVVVGKRARKGMDVPLLTNSLYRVSFPDLYWVDVQGENKKGKTVTKHVLVFRSDWSKIRVGDHWSKAGGFESTGPREGK